MARLSRDVRLETRSGRVKLKAKQEPYWRQIHPGLSIGYRKGAKGGSWKARRVGGEKYEFLTIGKADDIADANGKDILDYKQAHSIALGFGDLEINNSEYTVGDAITDYLKWFKAHRKSYRGTNDTIEAHIKTKFEKKRVIDVTTKQIRDWHHALADKPITNRGKIMEFDRTDPEAVRKRKSTANRVLTVLKAILNHAYQEVDGIKSDEAWRRVKPFKSVDQPKISYLSEAECTRLINASDPVFRLLVRAALFTGCRYGEIIRLKCHDYNSDSGTILVTESKAGNFRHVPLTDEGQEFFSQVTTGKLGNDLMFTRAEGDAWGKSHQSRPMKEACKVAKITPAASFHQLRHTYGSMLAMRGVPLQVIAKALGHADTRMTERHYAHLMPSYVADQIRAHLPSFGVEESKVEALNRRGADG